MKKTITYSLLLIFLLLGVNTLFQSSSNSPDIVSIVKPVKEFNRVVIKGRGNLHIMQTENESLKIVGDKSVVKKVKVTLQYGELVIALRKPGWFTKLFEPKENPDYYLHLKDLSSIKVFGPGNVSTEGAVLGDEISFAIDGSGKIEAKVNGKKTNGSIYGSGEINLLGDSDDLNLLIQGAGQFLGDKFEVKRANVTIEGSGQATLNVKDSLDVKVLGSGHVKYKNKPKIYKHISGSGSVSPIK